MGTGKIAFDEMYLICVKIVSQKRIVYREEEKCRAATTLPSLDAVF